MKVLFIGGTGIISSASSELAVKRGIDLYHLNRGESFRKIEGVKTIIADIRDFEATKKALENHNFDAVVDWIAFEPEHIENDIKLFTGKTKQFVFISSASIYQTPPERLPVTEDTPLYNPVWEYSQNKIACEDLLRKAYKENGFPYTIVRPSHTYDKTLIPMEGGYTVLHRMKKGLPVVVHGDGSSIWTFTNHRDFAVGLIGLLGKPEAINEAFHITNNELLSWNDIYRIMAKEMGVEAKLVTIPSEFIAKYDKNIGDSLLGDKMYSMIFDNSKIKKLVPEFNPQISFHDGVKEIVAWYNKPENQIVDEHFNAITDKMIADYKSL
ncbi:NAD-dependent epimerase/dehydratase family protein [Flaviramulus sp. BrNp1-15]|uniref:NAD-dependent epimerase/dehydratase family protein n=1 Tax=Flaviramulus sp. BrNp1-15 TaxID=2916754 RepID=UPI001EE928E7|nr:NAD-dependent epimerase/dehydratase family protein [Flaviramulus sp. BrNp1-15]ULC58557.1 NAD-dependent epimerase/dehydratase family protein [Flaviramulus sp. BrNp1-15]